MTAIVLASTSQPPEAKIKSIAVMTAPTVLAESRFAIQFHPRTAELPPARAAVAALDPFPILRSRRLPVPSSYPNGSSAR